MDKADKLQQLRTLSEAQLRRELLIPLLGRMGFRAVGEYHGTREHGKDIVCFDFDKLGERRYLGIVAKTTDLTGSVSSSNGLREVLHQAEQCFNESYYDLFGMRILTMDEVWIMTTGRVVPGAAASIFGTLQKTNLAKLTRIVAGEQLIEILDEHYPTYWNSAMESADQIRAQRDRLLLFLRNLLRKLGTTYEQETAVITQLLHSAWAPSIETLSDVPGSIVRASTYSLTVATTASRYVKGLASDQCGDLDRALRSAQESIRWELYHIEDLLENAEKAMATVDPREFVDTFARELQKEYPFYNSHSDAVQQVNYLINGLDDVDCFLQRLESAGKRDQYLQLVSSLQGLEPQLGEYLRQVETPLFSLSWEIQQSDGEPEILCRYSHNLDPGTKGFSTSHKRDVPTYSRWGPKTRPITSHDITEDAQLALRAYFEQLLSPERDVE